MKTTEQFPTFANCAQMSDDQYLFTAALSRKQVTELRDLFDRSRKEYGGRYHAMVVRFKEAIEKELSE